LHRPETVIVKIDSNRAETQSTFGRYPNSIDVFKPQLKLTAIPNFSTSTCLSEGDGRRTRLAFLLWDLNRDTQRSASMRFYSRRPAFHPSGLLKQFKFAPGELVSSFDALVKRRSHASEAVRNFLSGLLNTLFR